MEVFQAHEGTRYAQRHNVPLWVGEFGSVYNGPAAEVPDRLRTVDGQIGVFEQFGTHWTTWTYKDVGVMGWVTLHPESDYMQLIAPVLEAKRQLDTDFWMGWLPSTPAKELVRNLSRLTEEVLADPDIEPQANYRYLTQAALEGYMGGLMQPAYAKRFQGMSEGEIDWVLQSFALKNCWPMQGLVDVLKKHMARPA